MVEYTPELRTKAKLADNITTLAETMGKSREEYITIYRGTTLKQKEINPGDFITADPQLAKNYAGNGYVISKKVKLKDILNDRDGPLGEEYIYRPEKVLKADKGAKLLKKTERKFDENFRKISEKKFKKLQELVENNKKYTIRWNVSNRVIDFLKQEGLGNKILKQHIITTDNVKHILKQHGIGREKNPNQILVTMKDIEIIPEIQQNYDQIQISKSANNSLQKVVIYEKKIENYYYYLEKMNNHGNLETQTYYIRKTQKNDFK